MKGWMIGLIAVAVLVVIPVGVSISSYIGAHNTGVRYEANIEKFHRETQNTLSSYTMKIKDMAQIPDMYVEDLKKVIDATFQGRYGEDGSQATMQWIKEQNLNFDSTMYTRLQQTMEAGRGEFKLSQTKKLDICGNYEIARNNFWGGMWMKFAGYPKKDIDKLCAIILDTQTNEVFETGEAQQIKIR